VTYHHDPIIAAITKVVAAAFPNHKVVRTKTFKPDGSLDHHSLLVGTLDDGKEGFFVSEIRWYPHTPRVYVRTKAPEDYARVERGKVIHIDTLSHAKIELSDPSVVKRTAKAFIKCITQERDRNLQDAHNARGQRGQTS
jgi:hypothetical protein